MTASSFPVFWKDVRSLMKLLLAFLAMQAVWILGFVLLFWYWERSWIPLSAFGELMVLSGLGLGQIFGLVAGCYVFAEEAAAGTDVFLNRLPVSRVRITAEKLAAGLAAVSLLWLVQAAFHVIALPFGGLWSGGPSLVGIVEEAMSWITSPETVAGTLVLYYFGSYLVGVLVSLITKQPLVIVVVGYAIETIVYGFVMMGVDDALWITWDMAWLNLIVYAPLILVPLDVDASLVTGGALLLLVALGTASYSPVEKQGLDCLLYQHPVPRNHMFWAKTGAAVVPVLAVAAGTLVFWSRQAPPDVVTVLAYSGFAYAGAVLMTLTFERSVIALLAGVSLVVTTLLIPIVLIEFMGPVANVDITTVGVQVLLRPAGVPRAEAVVTFLGLAIPATLMAVGCLWVAWRMATNTAVLTGSPGYRLRYFAGHYSVIVAATYVVTLLSWRERLAVFG